MAPRLQFLELLLTVCPPPKRPLCCGSPESWQGVELQLGTSLPADYKKCVDLYGAGQFADDGMGIWVRNPYFRNPWVADPKSRPNRIEAFGISVAPYEHYPAPGGTLLCASTWNADSLFWLTRGHPDEWTILLWNECGSAGYYRETAFNLTEFLYIWVMDEMRFEDISHSGGPRLTTFQALDEEQLRREKKRLEST